MPTDTLIHRYTVLLIIDGELPENKIHYVFLKLIVTEIEARRRKGGKYYKNTVQLINDVGFSDGKNSQSMEEGQKASFSC